MNNYKQRFREKAFGVTKDTSGKIRNYIFLEDAEDFISQELNLLLDRVEKEIGEDEYEEEEFIEGKNMLRAELRQKIEEIRKEI